jgi:hypothetical protein
VGCQVPCNPRIFGLPDTEIRNGDAGLEIPQKEKFELAVVLGKIPKIQGLMGFMWDSCRRNAAVLIVGKRCRNNMIAVSTTTIGIIAR